MQDDVNINKDVLALQYGCIYGPVKSRRLKSSLGLNVLPTDAKLCSFNCIYCQYGQTRPDNLTINPASDIGFPSVEQVRKALVKVLQSAQQEIKYITFSGNGEATLHPKFPQLVEMLLEARDQYYPPAKTAILSNSTTLFRDNIREAIGKLDVAIMKLDAGTESLFGRINRPAKGISFSQIVEGLGHFRHPGLIIQALIMGGDNLNAAADNIEKWSEILRKINPHEVHIYSLDRPPALLNILQVSINDLQKIAVQASRISSVNIRAF